MTKEAAWLALQLASALRLAHRDRCVFLIPADRIVTRPSKPLYGVVDAKEGVPDGPLKPVLINNAGYKVRGFP